MKMIRQHLPRQFLFVLLLLNNLLLLLNKLLLLLNKLWLLLSKVIVIVVEGAFCPNCTPVALTTGAPPVGNAVEPAVAESNLQHSPLGPSATAAPSMGLRLKRFRVIEDDSQDDMEILSAMLIPEIGQVPRMPRTNGNIRLDDPGRPRVFAPETLSLHLPEAAASVPPPIPRGLLYSPPTEPQLISASGVSNEACPAAHLPPQGP